MHKELQGNWGVIVPMIDKITAFRTLIPAKCGP